MLAPLLLLSVGKEATDAVRFLHVDCLFSGGLSQSVVAIEQSIRGAQPGAANGLPGWSTAVGTPQGYLVEPL